MHDLYTRWEVGRYLSNALDNCEWGSAGEVIQALYDDPEVLFRWKRPTVYAYAQLGREEWAVVAKSGSVRKALEDMRDRNRTDAERQERLERKARMRNKESQLPPGDTGTSECKNDDEQAKAHPRATRKRTGYLKADASPIQPECKAMEECIEGHALAERMALKKLDLSEALHHTKDRKMERMGREAGALRVALAARPPSNGNAPIVQRGGQLDGNGNGNGSALLLSIGENGGNYVDPGEQS